MAQAKQRVLGGIANLKRILNKCHYARWKTAIKLVDVFVSPRFLWFSPCIHPTQVRLGEMQSLQLGLMAQILKLYVPDWMNPQQKRAVHRVRRRACLELIRVYHHSALWTVAWIKRKWTFLGHLMRRPRHDMTRQSLLTEFRQARPGRAVASARWVLTCVRELYSTDFTFENLGNMYCDKNEWNAMCDPVLQQHNLPMPTDLPNMHSGTWDGWADPHKCQTSWLATAVMCEDGHSKQFKWLDFEHGWLQLSAHGSWDQAITHFLQWRSMLYEHKPFVLQLLMPNGIDDADVKNRVQRLQFDDTNTANPVILLEEISDDWFLTLMRR